MVVTVKAIKTLSLTMVARVKAIKTTWLWESKGLGLKFMIQRTSLNWWSRSTENVRANLLENQCRPSPKPGTIAAGLLLHSWISLMNVCLSHCFCKGVPEKYFHFKHASYCIIRKYLYFHFRETSIKLLACFFRWCDDVTKSKHDCLQARNTEIGHPE